jgi:hypothetical protein
MAFIDKTNNIIMNIFFNITFSPFYFYLVDENILHNNLSVTKIAGSQKDFIFFSPERAATYQPRATPWVNDSLVFSPERALHKKSDQIKHVTPFQG